MRPRLIVITGSSGVGKSSLAMALQEVLLPVQWLHFSADTLFYCLPRSVVARGDRTIDEARHGFLNAITPTGSHCAFDTTYRAAPEIAVELAALLHRESSAA